MTGRESGASRREGGSAPPRRAPGRSDEEAILAVAEGNLEALGTLFDRHGASVRRYLVRMGLSPSESDDLVQATFLEVVRAAPRFDPSRAGARSWLFGIATMMMRRQRRSLGAAVARVALWVRTVERDPVTPAEVFEGDEMARRLEAALQRMSVKKREAFILITAEGFTGEQAARVLGIPVKTVWTRLHHARQELHRALEGDGGDT